MRKGWQQKKIKENAWGLHFERWYIIAPSGNKYFFYKGCYASTIYLPTTYLALSKEDKEGIGEEQLKRFKKSGKKKKHMSYTSTMNGKIYEYDDIIDDSYSQVLQFLYKIEDKGGFSEQQQMNDWLSNNMEMKCLFSQPNSKISYNSMPC